MDSNSLLEHSLYRSELSEDCYQHLYRGKVRDVYELNEELLAIVATDRVSAFDHVMRETIPFKGQILNQMAATSMQQLEAIVPVHLVDVPHPNLTIAHKCSALPVEVVVRGYLAGHALREYRRGNRALCGQLMPEGMMPYQAFETPLITPTTKARKGHDEDISEEQIIAQQLLSADLWKQIKETALRLFEKGSSIARGRGLLLMDTKYEFGLYEGKLMLIDETHTPDSSRFVYAAGYEERLEAGQPPEQLSKEFVREWLMEQGFSGKKGQQVPALPDEFRIDVYHRYAALYKQLIGQQFTPVYTPDHNTTLGQLIRNYL